MGNSINDIGINAFIREHIKMNNKSGLNLGDISLVEYNLNYYNSINKALNLKTKEDIIIFNTIYSIAYLDSYKILSNLVKKNLATEHDIIKYNELSAISNSKELRKYYLQKPERILYGIDSVRDFSEMTGINKISIVKSLTREENDRLNNVSPLHQNDLDKYDKTIDKEDLYKFYSNYKVHLNKKSEIDSKKAVTVMVTNFLKDIYFTEPTETKELIDSISRDVFSHLDSYKKTVPECETVFDSLTKLYEKEEEFSLICLRDLDIFEIVLGSYFSMKDFKIIKEKTYEKQ